MLAVTVDAADVTAGKTHPGDSFGVDFTVTFPTWTATNILTPPYTLKFLLTPTTHTLTDSTWGDWSWGTTTCVNT